MNLIRIQSVKWLNHVDDNTCGNFHHFHVLFVQFNLNSVFVKIHSRFLKLKEKKNIRSFIKHRFASMTGIWVLDLKIFFIRVIFDERASMKTNNEYSLSNLMAKWRLSFVGHFREYVNLNCNKDKHGLIHAITWITMREKREKATEDDTATVKTCWRW